MKNGVHETTEYLELFLRNLLLDEKNELAEWHEEYLKTKTLSLVEVKKGVHKYVDNDDEETKEKICQYYKREEELYEIREQKRKEAFELLAEYLGHLWW